MSVRISPLQHTARLTAVFFATLALIALAPLSASASTTTWSPVVDLSITGGNAYEPQVATDPNGNTTIVWYRYTAGKFIVQAASKPVGGSWSAVTNLSSATSDAWEPKIVCDDAGNVTVIWYWNDIVQTAYKPFGGSWGAVIDLTPGSTPAAHSANLAVDDNGNLAAIWIRDGKTQAATKPSGGSWGTATDLSISGSNASAPQIISDSDGNFTAIWSRNQIIQSTTLQAGGNWGSVSDVSASGANAIVPKLSRDAHGNTYAIWARGTTAQTAMKPANGSWSSPTDISAPLPNITEPKITSDPLGNLTALWTSLVSSKYVTYTTSKPVTGSWDAPAALSNPTQNASVKGQLTSDTNGTVTAAWSRSNGTSYIIQTASKVAGGNWSPATDLSTVGGNAADPQLGVDARGNVSIVWVRTNGTYTIVQSTDSSTTYSVNFAANGGAGTENPISYSTTGSALTIPTGSALSRDGFTFAGWNTAADGSGASYATGATFSPSSDVTLYATWTAVAPVPGAPELAATGTNTLGYLTLSGLLVLAGAGLLLGRRRILNPNSQ